MVRARSDRQASIAWTKTETSRREYLARLYQAQGRYTKAEPLFQRALETRVRTLGKE